MPSVSIYLHVDDRPEIISDAATVAKLRAGLGPQADHLVPAHDLAKLLRGAGRAPSAAPLERLEDAHVVRVVFS